MSQFSDSYPILQEDLNLWLCLSEPFPLGSSIKGTLPLAGWGCLEAVCAAPRLLLVGWGWAGPGGSVDHGVHYIVWVAAGTEGSSEVGPVAAPERPHLRVLDGIVPSSHA